VDYLSTVSGGGYIGSWYLNCLKENQHSASSREAALAHLRRFSQYLAPQAGFFSADTWTIVSIWIRNTLLLQAMLVCFFAIVLLLPRLLTWAFLGIPAVVALAAGLALLGVSVKVVVGCLRQGGASPIGQAGVQLRIVLPALVGSACLASLLWRFRTAATPLPGVGWTSLLVGLGLLVGACACWTATVSLLPEYRRTAGWLLAALTGVLGGAAFVGLGFALGRLFTFWSSLAAGRWLAGLIGGPAVLGMLGLTVILKIGLLGRAIDDGSREWWARLGAFLTIYALGPMAISALVQFGPQAAAWLISDQAWKQWMGGTVTVGGVLTTIGGVLAGRSPDTCDGRSSRIKELLATVAPYVFIIGLLVIVATGLHLVLRNAPGCGGATYWADMNCSIAGGLHWVFYASILSAAALALLARRIDINEASMNPFYRNRLVRCYLGASRAETRVPHPFTSFDTEDDFALTRLRPSSQYVGPVPILNTALSLMGGGDAGLQERRAASFFFTPYRSGSNWTGTINTGNISRYADGIRVGACMAASGAAASPNMGYHTSPPTAFLMTFFNVRLGAWIRNPKAGTGKHAARWGFVYLLKELFTSANAADHYIYLSDGGHFENLGIYELVRRRCRYIIACDAEADGNMTLHGLGSVVRKCRIDFGVHIVIDTSDLRTRDAAGRSRAHCAVGQILYPKGMQHGVPQYEKGYLVYLKSSLTGDEDSDVLQYKTESPSFPHEPTSDQFFTETQFESYRTLGQHVVEASFPFGGRRPSRRRAGRLAGARGAARPRRLDEDDERRLGAAQPVYGGQLRASRGGAHAGLEGDPQRRGSRVPRRPALPRLDRRERPGGLSGRGGTPQGSVSVPGADSADGEHLPGPAARDDLQAFRQQRLASAVRGVGELTPAPGDLSSIAVGIRQPLPGLLRTRARVEVARTAPPPNERRPRTARDGGNRAETVVSNHPGPGWISDEPDARLILPDCVARPGRRCRSAGVRGSVGGRSVAAGGRVRAVHARPTRAARQSHHPGEPHSEAPAYGVADLPAGGGGRRRTRDCPAEDYARRTGTRWRGAYRGCPDGRNVDRHASGSAGGLESAGGARRLGARRRAPMDLRRAGCWTDCVRGVDSIRPRR
jgi:hypothetical protein